MQRTAVRTIIFLHSLLVSFGATLAARAAPSSWSPDASAPGAGVFQYSVPVSGVSGRRAYLWIPPDCVRVRGLIFCLNNMLEERFTLDPTIRQAAADTGLGIVWIQPGGEKTSPLTMDLKNGNAADAVQRVLTDLANESGYGEVAFAPLLAVGHSVAAQFSYGIQAQMPNRIIAAISLKGAFPGWRALGIPNLEVGSQVSEHSEAWRDTDSWKKEVAAARKYRGQDERVLIGQFTDLSAGHLAFTPQSAPVLAMFIRKAVERRVPYGAPPNAPVPLNPIDPKSGCLVDPDKLGTPDGKPVPCAQWPGDPKQAFWYFDPQMAAAVNGAMLDQQRKRPQLIQPVENGQPVALEKEGFLNLHPRFESDGITFKVEATWYARAPFPTTFGGAALGHVSDPIQFRVGTGALDQTGPDRFRVALHRGVPYRQGNPWEPWVIACSNGNAEFRRADRPIHVLFNLINKKGDAQSIDFAALPDVPAGTKQVPLRATATSGLPIQYFLISGPAALAPDGKSLSLLPIPPRSRYPVRVIVAAFQWGRPLSPQVQSAGPVERTFFITK
ncbi:MAG TPA: hypothetical protein VGI81_08295 [Tepidisphaeraceae bacterium]